MKNFKKILAIVSLTAAAAACFAACGESNVPEEHEHSFANTWTYDEQTHWHAATCDHTWLKGDEKAHSFTDTPNGEATCTEGVEITRTCTCGYSYTYMSEPLGHDWKPMEGKNATCSADGYTAYEKCGTCGLERNKGTIQKVNHQYAYQHDDEGNHWQECIFGCKTELEGSRGTHTYTYEKNDAQHWQKCVCGVETAKTDHVYHNGICECGAIEATYVEYFEYVKEGGSYTVAGFKSDVQTGSKTEFSIPATHKGDGDAAALPVTAIAASAFKGNTTMTKLTLPESITSIGDFAFEGCSALQEINLPTELENLGTTDYQVFNGCASLTAITLPENITSIGANMFKGCEALATVTVNGTITSIDTQAFYGCAALDEIYFGEAEFTYIGQSAFANSGLNTIEIKMATNGRIAAGAFNGCEELTEAGITGGIQYFSDAIFKGCTALKTVTLPFVGAHINPAKSMNTTLQFVFGGTLPKTLATVNIKGGTVERGALQNCGAIAVNADEGVTVMTKTFTGYTGTFTWNGTLPGPELSAVTADKTSLTAEKTGEDSATIEYTVGPTFEDEFGPEVTTEVTVTKDSEPASLNTDYTVADKTYTFKTAGEFVITVKASYNGIDVEKSVTITVAWPEATLGDITATGDTYADGRCQINKTITLAFESGEGDTISYAVKKNGETATPTTDYELTEDSKTITFKTAGAYTIEVTATTKHDQKATKEITITVYDPEAAKPTISSFTADKETLEEGAEEGATLTTEVSFVEGDSEASRRYGVTIKETKDGGDYVNADESYYEITENVFKAKVAGDYKITVTIMSTKGGSATSSEVSISVTAVDLTEQLTVSADKLTNGWVRVAAGSSQEIEYSTGESYVGGYNVTYEATNGAQASAGSGNSVSVSLASPDTATITVIYTHKNNAALAAEHIYKLEIPVSFVTDVETAPVLGEDPFGGTHNELLNSFGLQLYWNVTDQATEGTQLALSEITFAEVSGTNTTNRTLIVEHVVGIDTLPWYAMIDGFAAHSGNGKETGKVAIKLTATKDGQSAGATMEFNVIALNDPDSATGINDYAKKVMGEEKSKDIDFDCIMERGNRENAVLSKEGIYEHRTGESWKPDANIFCVRPNGTNDFQLDFDFMPVKRVGGDNKTSFTINMRLGRWEGYYNENGQTSFYIQGDTNNCDCGYWGDGSNWDGRDPAPQLEIGQTLHIRLTHTLNGDTNKVKWLWQWSYTGEDFESHTWYTFEVDSSTSDANIGAPVYAMQFRHETGSFYLGNFKLTSLEA